MVSTFLAWHSPLKEPFEGFQPGTWAEKAKHREVLDLLGRRAVSFPACLGAGMLWDPHLLCWEDIRMVSLAYLPTKPTSQSNTSVPSCELLNKPWPSPFFPYHLLVPLLGPTNQGFRGSFWLVFLASGRLR